jgi:hypothetical protein
MYFSRRCGDCCSLCDVLALLQPSNAGKCVPVVELDEQLICEARRIINGANVHTVKQLIFAYEQAVLLHNIHWPTHKAYHVECENDLRRYVVKSRLGSVSHGKMAPSRSFSHQ